ncbi:hypothetical protein F383_32384 [Gossypium arboreum]|uniref:Uncharacterized protein n=1 Tax=Gossypium arboreum TaxID=29729 RepID=A0A0B0PK67_GOSAR|nr:hypothetical protein F383_32384 [Gossypium arboreum]
MLIHTLICKLRNLFYLKLMLCLYIPIPIHNKLLHIRNTVECLISRTLSVVHSRSNLKSQTKCHI